LIDLCLVGDARWKAAAKNLTIQQQITDKQQKLKACLIAFGGFSTQVVVLNLTAGRGGDAPAERGALAAVRDRLSGREPDRAGVVSCRS
jgi:hypothetical protein